MENTQLVHFDRARQELELATRIDEVKQIRDQAEVMRQYLRQQGGSAEMQNQAAAIKIRAERKLGQMLKETARKQGETNKTIMLHDETLSSNPSLDDLGISKIQSYRWQLESEVPEEKVDEMINQALDTKEELTSKAIIAAAQKIKRESAPPQSTVLLPVGQFSVIYADPAADTAANKNERAGTDKTGKSGAGITGSPSESSKDSPKFRALAKIPEGWHNTEKYGDVFVSPGGIAWVVQQQGNKLESVSVPLNKDDIVGKTAIEKRADAIRNQTRRTKSKGSRTQPPILTSGVAEVVVGKVAEVVK